MIQELKDELESRKLRIERLVQEVKEALLFALNGILLTLCCSNDV